MVRWTPEIEAACGGTVDAVPPFPVSAARQAFALGAAICLVNGGHLGLLRLAPAVLGVSAVSVLRAAGAAVVLRAFGVPAQRAADLQGLAQGPWLVWLLVVSLVPTIDASWKPEWTWVNAGPIAVSVAVTAAWSLRVRWRLLREALGLTSRQAATAVAGMAAWFWGSVLVYLAATDQLGPRL